MLTPASPRAKTSNSIELPPELVLFLKTLAGLTILSIVYCALMRFVLHRNYPYDWPFFIVSQRFSDFTIFTRKFVYFGRAEFFTTGFPINYPAPMVVLYEVLFKLGGHHALRLFLAICLLAFSVPAVLFARALRARGLSGRSASVFAGVCLLSSWPALILLDRANVEVLVWIATASAMWALARRHEWLAAALFGVAGSLKLFPFILLGVFLQRNKLGKLVFGAVVGIALIALSLFVVGPTISIANHGLNAGLASFRLNYMAVYHPDENGLDHSIMALIKLVIAFVTHQHAGHLMMTALNIYTPVMLGAGIALYGFRIVKLPWRNQLLALMIIGTYFTPFSGDGTLIHLYGPFALCCFLAIDASKRGVTVPGLRTIFLCFAWLFSIESFLVFKVRYEGQGKCIAMGVLLFLTLKYPLNGTFALDDAEESLETDSYAPAASGSAPRVHGLQAVQE